MRPSILTSWWQTNPQVLKSTQGQKYIFGNYALKTIYDENSIDKILFNKLLKMH